MAKRRGTKGMKCTRFKKIRVKGHMRRVCKKFAKKR